MTKKHKDIKFVLLKGLIRNIIDIYQPITQWVVEIWDVIDAENLFQKVKIKYAMGRSYAPLVVWYATDAENLFQKVKKENSTGGFYVPIVINISIYPLDFLILGGQFVKLFTEAIALWIIDFESKEGRALRAA